MSAELAVERFVPWVPQEFVPPEPTERYVRVILGEVFPGGGNRIDWSAVTKNGLAHALGPYPLARDPTKEEISAILGERFINGR